MKPLLKSLALIKRCPGIPNLATEIQLSFLHFTIKILLTLSNVATPENY